eukprot:2933212-Pleurochrysis_carterae.AAC.3
MESYARLLEASAECANELTLPAILLFSLIRSDHFAMCGGGASPECSSYHRCTRIQPFGHLRKREGAETAGRERDRMLQ